MNYINITVRGKIARAEGRARVVCGNSDYAVRFDFDAEWAEYAVKTARFVTEDGSYTDVQFEGDTCTIPILRNTRTLLVGVFAGNLRTTTAALIHAVPCITDPDGTPADPTPDVYAQLMERFNAIEAPAAVLYTAQELTDEQKATARENIGVATPDWEQSDEDQPDYIKNRPFYDATIALPKELITDVQDFVEYRLQPYVGKDFFDHLADYTVRYNSVDYKFDTAKSITFSGATFIGVGCHPIKTAACSPLTSSDVPFAIFRAAASPSVVWDNEPAFIDIHNIIDGNKDIEIFHTNVKQLDRKYIPDNRFIVTATADNNSNPTADKTFTEIKAAYDAGRTVVMGTPAGLAPLSEISDNGAAFRINLSRGLGVGSFGEFYMYPDNTIEMSDPVRIPFPSATEPSAPGTASVGASNNYARADHVHPRELPECSDADAGKVLTVAGNADVQWQLPSAGADVHLNITGATVGQIAKITAVDDSGKPTAWEAVDMPNSLPSVTDEDNGKFMRVVSGVWAAATIANANGVSF